MRNNEEVQMVTVLSYLKDIHDFFDERFADVIRSVRLSKYGPETPEISDLKIKELKNSILEEIKEGYSDFFEIMGSNKIEAFADNLFKRYYGIPIGVEAPEISPIDPKFHKEEYSVAKATFVFFHRDLWKIIVENFFDSFQYVKERQQLSLTITIEVSKRACLDFYPKLNEKERFDTFRKEIQILKEYNGIDFLDVEEGSDCDCINFKHYFKK